MSYEVGDRSLAQDRELIDRLSVKSDELLSKLAAVTPSLEQLTTESAKINLLFRNVTGDLNALSEKRFIENRVEVIHEKKTPPEPKTQAPRQATEDELREAVRVGLQSFGLLPAGELTETETGYECFQRERPFALVIGTQRWLEEDPLGGAEAPQTSGALEESLLSEAIDDLVSPVSPPFEIEEAAEAEEWFSRGRQERASSVSTLGGTFAEDSSSLSSASDFAQRNSVPTILPQPTSSRPSAVPGGLFDEDSDDDGDLFGITRKPSLTPPEVSQQKKPAEGVTAKLTSPSDRPAATGGPAQPSFLSELKSKTKQRAESRSSDSDGDEEDRRGASKPSTRRPSETPTQQVPKGQGTSVSHEIRQNQNHRAELPRNREVTTKATPAPKRPSLFDSDSDSDLLAPVAPLPKPLFTRDSQRVETRPAQSKINSTSILDSDQESERDISPPFIDPSTPTLSKPINESRSSVTQPKGLPKRGSLFNSESDSDSSDIFSRKPPAKPRTTVESTVVTSPPLKQTVVAETTSTQKKLTGKPVLPPLPVRPGQEDSESDEDIFGSRSAIPKTPSQIPELSPLSLEPVGAKNTEKETAAELQSREHIPKQLTSVVKPPSTESDDSSLEKVSPKVNKRQQVDQKHIPAKKPALFDSDSDIDSLFGDAISKLAVPPQAKHTPNVEKHRTISSAIEPSSGETDIRSASEAVTQDEIEVKYREGEQSETRRITEKRESVKRIGVGLPVSLLQSLKQKQHQIGIAPDDRKAEGGDSDSETRYSTPTALSKTDKALSTAERPSTKPSEARDATSSAGTIVSGPVTGETSSPIANEAKSPASEQVILPSGEHSGSPIADQVKPRIPVKVKPAIAEKKIRTPVEDEIKTAASGGESTLATQETKSLSVEETERRVGADEIVPGGVLPNESTMDQGIKKMGVGLPAGLLQGLKLKQQQLGIAPPQGKTRGSDSDSDSRSRTATVDSSNVKEQSAAASSNESKIVENKCISNITKGRARGPPGRRLPTRTRTQPSPAQEETDQITEKTNNNKVTTTSERGTPVTHDQVANRVSDDAEGKSSRVSQGDADNEVTPTEASHTDVSMTTETKKIPKKNDLQNEDVKSKVSLAQQQKAPLVINAAIDKPATERAAKRPAKLFSSDSDDDLFTPKTTSRNTTTPSKGVAASTKTAKTSVDVPTSGVVTKDPLSMLSDRFTEDSIEKDASSSVVASKVSGPPHDENKAPRGSAATSEKVNTIPPSRNDLFENSEDDDDLFGSKKGSTAVTPSMSKSSTSSSLSHGFGITNKGTIPQSQQSQNKKGQSLFGSDSDSDDLFKK